VAGERYVLCGTTCTTQEAFALLRRRIGRQSRAVWIPATLVRALGPLSALGGSFARAADPLVCPATVRTLLHGHRYDGSRASRELGVRYRPLEDTLDRTLAWAIERGLLPPGMPG
jgi:dihydroflavonol-4-reductase